MGSARRRGITTPGDTVAAHYHWRPAPRPSCWKGETSLVGIVVCDASHPRRTVGGSRCRAGIAEEREKKLWQNDVHWTNPPRSLSLQIVDVKIIQLDCFPCRRTLNISSKKPKGLQQIRDHVWKALDDEHSDLQNYFGVTNFDLFLKITFQITSEQK